MLGSRAAFFASNATLVLGLEHGWLAVGPSEIEHAPTDTVVHQALLFVDCGPRAEGATLSAKTYPAACAGSADHADTPLAGPP